MLTVRIFVENMYTEIYLEVRSVLYLVTLSSGSTSCHYFRSVVNLPTQYWETERNQRVVNLGKRRTSSDVGHRPPSTPSRVIPSASGPRARRVRVPSHPEGRSYRTTYSYLDLWGSQSIEIWREETHRSPLSPPVHVSVVYVHTSPPPPRYLYHGHHTLRVVPTGEVPHPVTSDTVRVTDNAFTVDGRSSE